MNTPGLETERLILRRFRKKDLNALFCIFGDQDVNTYLPWFPLTTMEAAERFFQERYAQFYEQPRGYRYAVCLKTDDVPIGYVHLSMESGHDLGFGLAKRFWHQGIATEACGAVIGQARRDGLPYLTATHDVNNPRSGKVMAALGMKYQYTYLEQWQPKNIPVAFRLYQLNLDGDESRVYDTYWGQYTVRYVETL